LSYFGSNVGIGTGTISYAHHVYGNVADYIGYYRQINSGGSGIYIDGESTGTTTPLRVRTTAGGQVLWVQSDGKIGMGTASPAATLHVAGSVADTFTWLSYIDSGTSWISGDLNTNVSIFAAAAVVADVFAIVSDARIKKNLTTIDDGASLVKLRLIEPTEYNYIDQIKKTNRKVYGFIAQQVREHFPEAVNLSKDYIPDIYATGIVNVDSQTVYIPGKARDGRVRLIGRNGPIELDVSKLDDDTIQLPPDSITEDKLKDGKVFVYGYQVNDFHNLNKDYLFTINFAATQELDRQVQQLQADKLELDLRVQQLQADKVDLQNQINALKDQFLQLMNAFSSS